MKVIEFFSGIGGMRAGLEAAGITTDYIIAYDTSPLCNATYLYNFGKSSTCEVKSKLVEQLTPSDVDGFDLWTMSPPCQPHTATRAANQLDDEDMRSAGLKHLIALLRDLKNPPKWIFLENVKGFHGSKMQEHLMDVLRLRQYSWQHFHLSPIQLGVPNNRKRYYLMCELGCRFEGESEQVRSEFPEACACLTEVRCIEEYLNKGGEEAGLMWEELLVSKEKLSKGWAKGMSIVSPKDQITFCFTGAYGKVFHKSSGSLLYTEGDVPLRENVLDRTDMTRYTGAIRLFSPIELLRLMGFPPNFAFPPDIDLRHRHKLVGNSLSVDVVTCLLRYLITATPRREFDSDKGT